MEQELISVLVPVYNVEKYIDRCLESIVNQTYNNIEIILVVQPSTDNTEKKAEEWIQKDKRIRIIHQEKADIAVARNRLVKESKGELIAFVDSDDIVHNKYIEVMYDVMKKENADIVHCMVYAFKDEKTIPTHEPNYSNYYCIDNINYIKSVWNNNAIPGAGVFMTNMFRKKLFDEIIFPEGRINEDTAILYKINYKARKIVVYREVLYFYQSQRKDSLTHLSDKKNAEDGLLAAEEAVDFFCDKEFELYMAAIYGICNRIVRVKRSRIEESDVTNNYVIDIIHRHKFYTKKYLQSKIGTTKRQKIIVALGYYMPCIYMLIWEKRRQIKSRLEWRNRG